MALQISPRFPRLPLILQRRSTDEYTPLPYSALDRRVIAQVRAQGPACATRLGFSLDEYWSSRQGTAAALRALDDAWGGGFYHVPSEAAVDRAAADVALGGDQLVIDVQTHDVSDRRIAKEETAKVILGLGESVNWLRVFRSATLRPTIDEYSAVRKRRGTPWQRVHRNAHDHRMCCSGAPAVYWPHMHVLSASIAIG